MPLVRRGTARGDRAAGIISPYSPGNANLPIAISRSGDWRCKLMWLPPRRELLTFLDPVHEHSYLPHLQ